MSRKTHLYRIGSPSITQRNRELRQTGRYASILDSLVITLIKTFGSSMQEDEWSLTIPAGGPNLARAFERLTIADGPNNEILLRVEIDPALAEQVAAFKEEMKPQTATSEPLLPVEPVVVDE